MPVKAIHTFCQDDATRIYAWARYVFWAEVEGQQYDTYELVEDESPLGVGTVLMLHFYSALWVAIEAWRKCPLTDETIDELPILRSSRTFSCCVGSETVSITTSPI